MVLPHAREGRSETYTLLVDISRRISSVMTEKFLKNEQFHSRKKSFVPEEIRRDFPSRVTVDHYLGSFKRQWIFDGKSLRKSSVVFPLVWQDH